ncbi:glycoside hydrolase family 88/105 protein [Alloacidobacterium sp.]|uniref:glycoside hydrolase family 88/105 protein n=1 Tax=Alloacidobacterium sp. TaxID=2951999 RepID=UPI002D6B9E69|nr:glycoside hydrolase family 88 protein [Alloacidobacterium sp.]HYK36332.1 glycoside hydrolase family 88 protein [Alloacidobacterium sp.]
MPVRSYAKPLSCCILSVAILSASCAYAQHLPNPQEQKRIDEAIAIHIGDVPDNAGPLAKNLSPKLNQKAVETAIRKVTNWELERSQPYFGDEWTWSALYVGFMAASNATGDSKYNEAMLEVGKKFNWKLRSHLPNADDQSIGQTYTELYMQKRDPEMIAGTLAELDDLIAHENDPAPRIPWWWCDALFMAPPVWARMNAITHDGKYLAYLDREWWKTSSLLYDPQEHLYFRDATYLNKTEPNGQKMFWSRGNGWVLAGLARVLQYFPKDDPRREKYVQQYKEMAAKLIAIQGKDGLWRSGLLDPAYYVLPENSGSSLITYGLAYGVNEGILDRKTYAPAVKRAWKGLLSHIHTDGRLDCIQQVDAAPAFYKPTSSYVFGVGGFLLASSEVDRMAKEHK